MFPGGLKEKLLDQETSKQSLNAKNALLFDLQGQLILKNSQIEQLSKDLKELQQQRGHESIVKSKELLESKSR